MGKSHQIEIEPIGEQPRNMEGTTSTLQEEEIPLQEEEGDSLE